MSWVTRIVVVLVFFIKKWENIYRLDFILFNFDVIETVKSVESQLSHIKKPITVSIIGCVVNGPGEATMTNIGITGGGKDTHMIYVDGKKSHRIHNENLVEYLVFVIVAK